MVSKKILTARWIFWCLSVAIMVVVFISSAKTATQSSEISKNFADTLFEIIISDYSEMEAAEQIELVNHTQFPVRKAAHFSVFFALGFCVSGALSTYKLTRLKLILFSQGICTLYAISDEFHQLFVEGRAGRVYDVIIDSVGAFVGVLAVILALYILNFVKRRMQYVRK